jgi:hypothetical protein
MKAYPDCNGDRVKTCPDCNGDGVVDKDTDDERQCPTCGGLGFVPDDDDHEEVIKTSRVALSLIKCRMQTLKTILGVSLVILLMPSAYAAFGRVGDLTASSTPPAPSIAPTIRPRVPAISPSPQGARCEPSRHAVGARVCALDDRNKQDGGVFDVC